MNTAASAVTITYRGCTSSEKTALTQAVSDAAQYSAKSEAWLASNPSGGGTYSTWFGSYNSSRFNHVTSVYSRITSELTTKTLLLDCTSDEDYYAYVYPNDPYTIYLCAVYWRAPAKGDRTRRPEHSSTSRATSPSTAAPTTTSTARAGRSNSPAPNPAYAVTNADNFEYFAENQ